MTKRFGLLLLDANIVIALFQRGLWRQVLERCEIHLAQTVVDESQFFQGEEALEEIDLRPWIETGAIRVIDVPLARIDAFRRRFSSTYLEQLDPGETESLA